jgi:hypothetical protein
MMTPNMSTDCGEKFENPDSFHVVYMGDERSFSISKIPDILTKMVNIDDDFRRLPYTQATFDHWQRIRHEATLPLTKLAPSDREEDTLG